jgi:putative membrane protein
LSVRVVLMQLVFVAIAIWLVALLLPGVDVTGGAFTYLWLAFLLAGVNLLLGPVLHLLALPLTILTLGLFAIVVNTALVAITAGLSGSLAIDSFWAALGASVLISLFTVLLNKVASSLR